MDFVGEQYYKLNRILLLCLGLWPYQSSPLKKIQIIFFQTLFISFVMCQFSIFFIKECFNIDVIIKVCTYIVFNCIFIIKYNASLLLTDNIKFIFDRIRYDWNMLKTQAELEIIRGYADYARLNTIYFVFIATISLLGMFMMICAPCLLDVTAPMNETRSRRLPMEYFIDNEAYFYTILIHIGVTCYAGTMTIAAIATLLIAYVLHTCAMFKIASLADILTNSFATLYFVLLGFGIASTSLSFLGLFNAIESLDKVEVFNFICVITVHLYYIFIANYVGQDIIDSSIEICQTTYNTPWYKAPLWMQKLILFVMQRSSKRSSLTAGGLFDASLEGFATIISMSISYVMVLLHSTRAQQVQSREES